MDWYEEHIEEGVRDVVKLLRDNGFNTECSCHHDMHIQIQFIPGVVDFQQLHNLLWVHLYERGEPVSFKIELIHEIHDGHWDRGSSVIVHLTGRTPVRLSALERQKALNVALMEHGPGPLVDPDRSQRAL